MAILSDVLTFSRVQAQTDTNGLTNANGIIFANEALVDFRRQLQSAGVDASQVQESYENMTANVGTYLWPTDMFWLKTVELNYANQTADQYLQAQQIDVSNLPGGASFGWLRENANTSAPYFDDRGDWFEIFPTPQSTNSQGIRIFYFLEPTEYTAVSDTISYPESLDYRILGWRIASSYYKSLNKFDEATFLDAEYQKRIKQLIATLSRGTQQPIQAIPLQDDGWSY